MKYKAKLIRVEFYGGPLDGKWLTVAEWQESFLFPSAGRLHRYDRDEVYEPSVRTIFRHTEIMEVVSQWQPQK